MIGLVASDIEVLRELLGEEAVLALGYLVT